MTRRAAHEALSAARQSDVDGASLKPLGLRQWKAWWKAAQASTPAVELARAFDLRRARATLFVGSPSFRRALRLVHRATSVAVHGGPRAGPAAERIGGEPRGRRPEALDAAFAAAARPAGDEVGVARVQGVHCQSSLLRSVKSPKGFTKPGRHSAAAAVVLQRKIRVVMTPSKAQKDDAVPAALTTSEATARLRCRCSDSVARGRRDRVPYDVISVPRLDAEAQSKGRGCHLELFVFRAFARLEPTSRLLAPPGVEAVTPLGVRVRAEREEKRRAKPASPSSSFQTGFSRVPDPLLVEETRRNQETIVKTVAVSGHGHDLAAHRSMIFPFGQSYGVLDRSRRDAIFL